MLKISDAERVALVMLASHNTLILLESSIFAWICMSSSVLHTSQKEGIEVGTVPMKPKV